MKKFTARPDKGFEFSDRTVTFALATASRRAATSAVVDGVVSTDQEIRR